MRINPFHPYKISKYNYIHPGYIVHCITCNTLFINRDENTLKNHVLSHRSIPPGIYKDMPELDKPIVVIYEPSLCLIPKGIG